MRSHVAILGAATVLLALSAPSALANAGTPLLLAGIAHLAIGNAIIGLLEGLILQRWFGGGKRAVGWMILANYISAWAGFLILPHLAQPITIENALAMMLGLILLSLLLTLALEFPFVLLSLRPRDWKSAVKAVLGVHAVTFPLMLLMYAFIGSTGLVTGLRVIDPAEIDGPENAVVYYIDATGKTIMETDLRGRSHRVVTEIPLADRSSRLYTRPNADGRVDLFLLRNEDSHPGPDLILEDVSPWYVPDSGGFGMDHDSLHQPYRMKQVADTTSSFGSIPTATPDSNSAWKYETSFWASPGLICQRKGRNSLLYFGLETPLISWQLRNATVVEGDKIILQVGRDQICIINPQTRNIALLARGYGCITVIKPK